MDPATADDDATVHARRRERPARHRHAPRRSRACRSRARPAPRRPRPDENPHAWFIAFAPADHPRYAIAVLVEHGGADGADAEATGGRVAAPVATQVLQALLATPAAAVAMRRRATIERDRMADRVPQPCPWSARSSPTATKSQREIAQGGMAEVYLARDQLLEPAGRAEGAVPRVRARAVVRRAVPARGAGRREPQPPQHRRDLRLGPGGRHVLHRDGVRRRPIAARPHPRRGAARRRARPPRSPPRSRRRSRSRTATASCTAT